MLDGLECRPLGDLRMTRTECQERRASSANPECATCPVGALRLTEWLDEARWPGGDRVREVRFSREVMTTDGRSWPDRDAYERNPEGKKMRKTFTEEEKRAAVERMTTEPIVKIAKSIGATPGALRAWRSELGIEAPAVLMVRWLREDEKPRGVVAFTQAFGIPARSLFPLLLELGLLVDDRAPKSSRVTTQVLADENARLKALLEKHGIAA